MLVHVVGEDEDSHSYERGEHQQDVSQDGCSRCSIHSHGKVSRQVTKTMYTKKEFSMFLVHFAPSISIAGCKSVITYNLW